MLKHNPCIKCGIKDFRVLQFNHKRGKLKNISALLNNACSLDKFIEEIHKCEVRCSNCHKLYTARKQNWYRLRWYENHKRRSMSVDHEKDKKESKVN